MLMDTQSITTDTTGHKGTSGDATARERAWLKARFERGLRERFVEVVPKLTPGLARLMLDANVHNRAKSAAAVAKYAKIMAEGRWGQTTQGLAFARNAGLIDGQHRLTAIWESGVTVPMTVWFGCQANEFALIDTGKVRSGADLISIEGLTYHLTRGSLAGLHLRFKTRSQRSFDADTIRRAAVEMQGADTDVALVCGSRLQRLMGVAAASYAYLMIARASQRADMLPAFWEALVSGANLATRSPILRVREYLRTATFPNNNKDRATKQAAAVIIAWNAYVQNQTPRSFFWERVIELPEIV